MPDRSFLLLFDEVRGKTLRLLDGVTEEHARWAPPGLRNHILWHSGHCYVLVEWFTQRAVDQRPEIPKNWLPMFDWNSDPDKTPEERWQQFSSVANALKKQHYRLRHIIDGLTEEELTSPVPSSPNHTVRYAILHGIHDEACHGGEIWLLRKLMRTMK
jgi:hypothetical protein